MNQWSCVPAQGRNNGESSPRPAGLAARAGVLLCVLLAWSCLCPPASAAPGTAPLRDYAIDAWTSRNGLPHNSLRDIAQTPEGHLWFATWEGLVRYNGLEFTVIDRGSRPGLLDNGVGALYVDRDGALWLTDSRGNLGRLSAQGGRRFWPRGPDWPKALIHAMAMDAQGRMWLLFEGQGLGCIGRDGRFAYFPPPADLPLASSFPKMVFDGAGRLLIGTFDGLLYREPDGRLHRASFALPSGLAWPYRAADGTLWVVAGGDLYQLQGERAVLKHRVPGQGHITALLQDRQGELWLGTENSGLLRIGERGIEHLGTGSQLPTGRIVSLLEDAEGSIWLGANGGLYRLRETLFTSYTHADGLSSDYSRALLEDRHGALWIGGAAGLDRMDAAGRIHPVALAGELGRAVSVLSLAEDAGGDLWVGSYADGAYQLRDGRLVRRYDARDGVPGGHIRAIAVDPGGTVWLGTQRGVVGIRDGRVVAAPGDVPQSLVTALAYIDGALWIGTVEGASVLHDGELRTLPLEATGGARSVFGFRRIGNDVWIATDRGLYRDRGGTLARVGLEQGMPVDTVFQILPDPLGNAWITSNRGVLRTGLDDLDAVADGHAGLEVQRYGEIDGMANAQGNGSSGPSLIERRDGTLWLVTAGGVATVNPSRLGRFQDRMPPPLVIESVRMDGRPLDWRSVRQLPGGHRLDIAYVGLSFLMPERIEYRTRLDGLDAGWVERGRLHNVELMGLPPGDYALHVSARHPGGRWSEREALWRFSVAPLWWQRLDVRLGTGLALVAALVALYVVLLRRYRTRNQRLEEQVRERTAALSEQAQRLMRANQETSELLARLRLKSDAFERQAHEDALTGLPNRRHFDEALARDLSRARRSGRPLSLVILDLDHFKAVNDVHSHVAGDNVLQEMGALLASGCRASDLPARLGGEEFALLLSDTPLQEALLICARIRDRVHAIADWGGVEGLRVTFSAGVAELREDENGTALMQRTDQALYRAKNEGRDCISAG